MSHDSSLEPVLRAVEPAARLLPERHLRQVLNYLIDWGVALPTNPELPLWVNRTDLVSANVLPSRVMEGTEPTLLLITDPNDRMIDRKSQAEQLRVFWEVLFEAAIMQAIDRKIEAGSLTPAICSARLNQFGPAIGREISYVLESEHLVSPEADDVARYRSFAAVYLCCAIFRPYRLEALFPSLPHGDIVKTALAEDVDADALLARTRLPHALEPEREPAPDEQWGTPDTAQSSSHGSISDRSGILRHALDAEQNGNNVRAAILRTQVAAHATGDEKELALTGARTTLGKLVDSLGDMFAWDHGMRQEWRQALNPLLDAARSGVWPRAARCLYELQKIPANLSREVYAVDLAEAIRTLGKRPVKRPLPRAKPVLILMGLRRAHTQLIRANLGHAAQFRLDRLFHHQLDKLEHNIRHELTPVITDALAQAGLVATNTVDEVAREKLVAELIDRVCSLGYLRIGDLRDAIARNRLKMPDLSGPAEFLRGDPLLKADLNLAYALDGIYRKGEFYLRWLQRGSSLFFATPLGRALFLYLLLPFAGGFMAVVGAQEMTHIGEKIYNFAAKQMTGKQPPPPQVAEPVPVPNPANPPVEPPDGKATTDEVEVDEETGDYLWQDAPHPVNIVKDVFIPSQTSAQQKAGHHTFHVPWNWVGGLAVFLFLVIHISAFRRGVIVSIRYLWWALRGLLWDVPMGVWRSDVVRGIKLSRPVRLVLRYFWSPLLIAAIVIGLMSVFGTDPRFTARWGWAIWAGLTLFYNTPWGWVIQDRIAEQVSDWWRVVRVNLIPGFIATIIDLFRRLGNWIERRFYSVDERLRFRGGDSQGSLVVKSLLGLIWFPFAYVFRFAFNLLLEPQINPVKHFPVVTVSHKLLLPLVVSGDPATVLSTFGEVLANSTGWGVEKANFWAFWIVAGIPGVFGFIAWELLANWRLYAANRSELLRPVTLGSHGESMRGLLRPGFHSGTIPKLFRKMRTANHTKASRLHHEVDHAVEGVYHFVDREVVHLLSHSPDWGGIQLKVGSVLFGCQRVTVELVAPTLAKDAFVLGFENVDGGIEARVEQTGWLDKLTDVQRGAFIVVLRGMLDMAATDCVNGETRSDEMMPRMGLADLARRVSWTEWGNHWNLGTKTTT
ncbi:MAG: hypothetical protein K8U57_03030 [Planctomycetes bacterium]|nr:hypothetical protein [Planctomycetota bacterium]